MSNTNFAEGVYFSKPSERAPDFIVGNISFVPERLIPWLQAQTPNENGYVNCQIKIARSGKPYVAIDDYKPGTRQQPERPVQPESRPMPEPETGNDWDAEGDIPF